MCMWCAVVCERGGPGIGIPLQQVFCVCRLGVCTRGSYARTYIGLPELILIGH